MGETVRLQKYIAMSGAASRRKAEEMIDEGRVKVNGEKIDRRGVKVEIGADKVELDGVQLKIKNKKQYIMLNKPSGYVTTVKDQFDRPTVMDLINGEISERLFPVGRLDYETEGLLLLSNDGDFAYRVTHPKFRTDKTYIAVIGGGVSAQAMAALRRGVRIDGYVTSPAELTMLDATAGKTTIRITIHEGRNRQVRKMFEAVGCKVIALERIKIGNVELGTLPLGRWRHLTAHEVNYLMKS